MKMMKKKRRRGKRGRGVGKRKLMAATQWHVHWTLIGDFMRVPGKIVCWKLDITPTFLDQEAHTPGSSFLYGWDSRLPVRTGMGTGRQKTSRICGQMWDSWWLCGLRTTCFTAADGDHWWNPSRDFAEQPPHEPLGTTTLVLSGRGLQVTSLSSDCSFPELPRDFPGLYPLQLPIICVNPNSYIKPTAPGISSGGLYLGPNPD